jgi:hypothetical protein
MKIYHDEYSVFKWFKRFKEGRAEITDNPCPSQPCTSKTDANINKESIRQILHEKSVLEDDAKNPHS